MGPCFPTLNALRKNYSGVITHLCRCTGNSHTTWSSMTASICKHGTVLLFVARKMSGGLGAKWDAHGQDKTCGRVGNSAPSPKEDAWSTAVVQINADGQILSGVSSSIPLLGLGVCREHLQGSNGRSGPSALGDY